MANTLSPSEIAALYTRIGSVDTLEDLQALVAELDEAVDTGAITPSQGHALADTLDSWEPRIVEAILARRAKERGQP